MMQQLDVFGNPEAAARAQQFRLRRLQVFNWGTFSGLHDIPIAGDGFLFVGRSGSGKSTLLDAFTALLIPPLWRDFNAAAREGDRGRADRNLVTYVRGAWADQSHADSGEIHTRMLRATSTWSALAAEYTNELGQVVSLAQLFWIKGASNRTQDVRRHFMIVERPFEIGRELKGFAEDLDLRRLKQSLPDLAHFEQFEPYGERFRRLCGIDSKMALKLLHKTQSAKNLGDLNSFLREFMLDPPATFDVAGRLVEEFGELDEAHRAVVNARRQIETLAPARNAYRDHQRADQDLKLLDDLLGGVDAYHDLRRRGLLEEEAGRLEIEERGLAGRESRQREVLHSRNGELRSLEEYHRERGGGRIETLEDELQRLGDRRDDRLVKRRQAEKFCRNLDWSLPDSPEGLAELTARARDLVEGWNTEQEQAEKERDGLRDRKRDLERERGEVETEVAAMLRQPSNIPAHMLELRNGIACALGLSDLDLPFVGELIEVKEDESDWRGAIERVLHGFALSLLVDERRYGAVARYVNQTHLGQRLVYFRVSDVDVRARGRLGPQSLVAKLDLQDTSYRGWLLGELYRRFDYACVDNLRAFQERERALTREGQIKQGRSRHEKDDRHRIDDRRRWVLGFDNRDKLALFQQRAGELREQIGKLSMRLKRLDDERHKSRQRADACLLLANLQWQDIDVATVLDRIQSLAAELQRLRSGDSELKALGERIEVARKVLEQAEDVLREIQVERAKIGDQLNQHQSELADLDRKLENAALSETRRTGLQARFEQDDRPLTLGNLERRRTRVERALNAEHRELVDGKNQLARTIEKGFADFKREWPVEAGDLDETLASAPEYLTLLQRIEHDGLPGFEERFFTLLKEQSSENLAALSRHIVEARKQIRDRMELVNASLSEAEFNPGTHLQIEVSERQLPDVRSFREQVRQVLEHAWTMGRDAAEAEARFATLRDLVRRLGGQESEDRRWREQVLDVRLHVEFVGRELDGDGREVEVYRSGAGKSGGQREKLATTCLAAALRYQLGGSDGALPVYAPVVLDEAFGKADNEFTELAMRIFERFGFQMIVATPLKSVMTLEPFIGGACFVDIADRNRSATLQIAYDLEHRRLDLPDRDRLLPAPEPHARQASA